MKPTKKGSTLTQEEEDQLQREFSLLMWKWTNESNSKEELLKKLDQAEEKLKKQIEGDDRRLYWLNIIERRYVAANLIGFIFFIMIYYLFN